MKLKYAGLAVASLLLSGQATSLWAWDCVLGQVRPQCPASQNQLQLRGRKASLPLPKKAYPASFLSVPAFLVLAAALDLVFDSARSTPTVSAILGPLIHPSAFVLPLPAAAQTPRETGTSDTCQEA